MASRTRRGKIASSPAAPRAIGPHTAKSVVTRTDGERGIVLAGLGGPPSGPKIDAAVEGIGPRAHTGVTASTEVRSDQS